MPRFLTAVELDSKLTRLSPRVRANLLVDIVLRYTPELIAMPPAPRAIRLSDAGRPLWEITREDPHGKVISEAAI